MDKQEIIEKTVQFVKETLANAEGGHDWWHIRRVWKVAQHIAKDEKVDRFVVELGALLHDIADRKFNNGDETIGPRKAKEFLLSIGTDTETVNHVEKIVANVSYSSDQDFNSPELSVVQDADRLDALGATGIARCLHFGGHKNRTIYDPNIKPKLNMTKEEYRKHAGPSMNHFHEKLLTLKDGMNTATGKKMAQHRHDFMQKYVGEFYKEWEGEQ